MEADRSFLCEFIEVYKFHTALWNTKCDFSINKYYRAKGIDALLKLCKEKYQEADEAFVKRSINNIRTAFRREWNKVLRSKCTGSSSEDIYVPTLWYYDLLLFTIEDESGRLGISSLDDCIAFKVQDDHQVRDDPQSIENVDTSSSTSDYDSPTTSRTLNHVSKQHKKLLTKKKTFLDLPSETMKSLNTPPIEEDECSIIGKRFAFQLRSMTDGQKLLAEKIIGDVMYYGRMDKLTENSFEFKSENERLNNRAHQRSSHLVPQANRPISQQQQSKSLYQQIAATRTTAAAGASKETI